jgi:hypothetical protein
MEFLNIWIPLIGGGILWAIAIGAWFSENKITGVWFGFSGTVCLLFLFALHLHEHFVGERELAKAAAVAPAEFPERPWISVGDPIVASPLKFLDAGATIALRFPIKNTGKSPALNVSLQAELIPMTPERSAPHVEQERFIAELKARPDNLVFGERTLFVGDAIVAERNFFVPKSEIDNASALLGEHSTEKNQFLPILVACAVYKFNRTGERHYTCIVGDVHRAVQGMGGLSVPFDTKVGEVPMSQISATQLYAGYID